MKTIIGFFFALFISASLAQITFTREWVKGKRSTSNTAALSQSNHSICRSLVSAVDYLIELEKMRAMECSECRCNSAPPALPVLPDIQRSPDDFMAFLRDISPLEKVPQERIVGPPSDRRAQVMAIR